VPLIAVVGFAGLTLVGNVRQVINAGTAQSLAALAADAGALARALQVERAAAAVVVTSTKKDALEQFNVETAHVDTAITVFERHGIPTIAVAPIVQRVGTGLASLPNVRGQVRYSAGATLSSVSFRYRILIADLLGLREAVAAGASVPIVDDVRASAALAQVGESIGQLQTVVLRSLATGELTPDAQQAAAAATAQMTEASTDFLDHAEPSWSERWEQVGANPLVITAQRLRDQVARTVPGNPIAVSATDWVSVTNAWMNELYEVQRIADAAVAGEFAAVRVAELQSAGFQAGAIALALALTAVLTSAVARRITRRLRRLQDSASAAAYQRLPVVVRELNAAPAGMMRLRDFADQLAAEIVVDAEDEIAAVGAALRELFREAVLTAGEQAVMRKNVADMFVHLSHREQRLVEALLVQVDAVEYDETDPNRLRQLYELDNLATRMGRINKSLLVLGGSGSSRVRPEAVPIVTVVQAALSQIEQYSRVRIGALDNRLSLQGDTVDETAHMLAELLDNATSYSAPETEVWVTGQPMADRLVLQVTDQGVGLSDQRLEQINRHLAAPAPLELVGVRSMGLMVVSRLAARHGIRVELRKARHRGTAAEVTIPWSLLSWRTNGDNAPSATTVAAGRSPAANRPAVQPRSAMLSSAPAASASAAAPGARMVNGWFTTARDGADVAIVWPASDGERWAAAVERDTSHANAAPWSGLPRRVPQPDLVPDAPVQGATSPRHRRLDPTSVAAAMSAYARGVAGYRAPPTNHASRSLERPS
jgi:signal transduction histidine kinase